MAAIGVALSGGGHRATTWALGALMYLADSGRNTDVVSIASVSGGSIANGVVAEKGDFRACPDGQRFRADVRDALRLVAREGLFAWGPATNWYLWLLLAVGLALLGCLLVLAVRVVDTLHGAPPAARDVVLWGVGALLSWLVALALFSLRSLVVDRALARRLFRRDGREVRLADVRRDVGHVFCATEIQTADHLYLAPEFVATYRLGVGEPGDLPLATAVQCSACLPGAFRPRRLPAARHRLRPFPDVDTVTTDTLVLQDGGVYDNMADQWHQGFHARLTRWPELADVQTAPEILLVVNASGGWVWEPFRRRGLLLTEVFALLRAKSILYDGTTAQRRRALVERFDRAAQTGAGLRGALVHIPQSPWEVADALSRSSDPGRAARARAVRDLLAAGPHSREEWQAIAARSTAVPTTLGKLGVERTAELLFHAYTLTMCNTHIVLDFPLLALPDRDELRALVR